jgi:two-component system chemotaxis response regulator CheY
MKKILIVDDSMFMRMTLRNNLPKGCEVIEADTGAKALEQFKEQKPDIVLLDIVMPEGEEEGISVLQRIMKSDPNACVIMITAIGQDVIMNQCKELGAKDYIVKPFDEKEVADKVGKYLCIEVH